MVKINDWVGYTPNLSIPIYSVKSTISDSVTGEEVFAAIFGISNSMATIVDDFAPLVSRKPQIATMGNIGQFDFDRNLIDSGSRISAFVSVEEGHAQNVPTNEAIANYLISQRYAGTVLSETQPEDQRVGDAWLKVLPGGLANAIVRVQENRFGSYGNYVVYHRETAGELVLLTGGSNVQSHVDSKVDSSSGAHGLRYDGTASEIQRYDVLTERWVAAATRGAKVFVKTFATGSPSWSYNANDGIYSVRVLESEHHFGNSFIYDVSFLKNNEYVTATGYPSVAMWCAVNSTGNLTLYSEADFAGRVVMIGCD